jgi:hypothetical protein
MIKILTSKILIPNYRIRMANHDVKNVDAV